MPILVHVFSTSDRMYYRTYLSVRQTCSIPTEVLLIYKCSYKSCIFLNPKKRRKRRRCGNVRVDVTEPLITRLECLDERLHTTRQLHTAILYSTQQVN